MSVTAHLLLLSFGDGRMIDSRGKSYAVGGSSRVHIHCPCGWVGQAWRPEQPEHLDAAKADYRQHLAAVGVA
jgi:hypothetical protein